MAAIDLAGSVRARRRRCVQAHCSGADATVRLTLRSA